MRAMRPATLACPLLPSLAVHEIVGLGVSSLTLGFTLGLRACMAAKIFGLGWLSSLATDCNGRLSPQKEGTGYRLFQLGFGDAAFVSLP